MRSGHEAIGGLLVVLSVIVALAAPPYLVAAIHSQQLADLSPAEAIIGTLVVAKGNWGNPATGYPTRAQRQMPDGAAWWALLASAVAALAAAAAKAAGRLDVLLAQSRVGRRPYDLRGSRPRAWARPRDVAELVVKKPTPGRRTLGRLDRRLLAGDPEANTLVCAPPRAGKTTGYVIPWLLEHNGPALVISTKDDVLKATGRQRAEGGRIWVYDPFSPDSCHWNPIEGCEDWGHSLRQAHWLTEAATKPNRNSNVEEFWGDEAAKLLAPLLHAAALAGGEHPIGQVVRWLETDDRTTPIEILKSDGDPAAQSQLEGILALDPRNTGTTYMSATHLLQAYRFPEVLATATNGFNAKHLLDGDPGTLYLTALSSHQKMLSPILVGLISSVIHAAIEKSRATGHPLDPTLVLLLDEIANCAALQSLPGHLSEVPAYGVRIATFWQSIGQMRDRYGDAKDTILGASTDKIFLGSIADKASRDEVVALLGQRRVQISGRSSYRPKVSAQELQQLGRGRAVVVSGARPPVVAAFPW